MPEKKKDLFSIVAKATSAWTGKPIASIAAFSCIVIWGLTGPLFKFSDTWQLVINTGTTIITFLMVFLIQNTQNRDTTAIQLKLDELIRATEGAHTVLLDLEELSDKEICTIRDRYQAIAEEGRQRLREGKSDTYRPKVVMQDEVDQTDET